MQVDVSPELTDGRCGTFVILRLMRPSCVYINSTSSCGTKHVEQEALAGVVVPSGLHTTSKAGT